jgi:hypothetical protein
MFGLMQLAASFVSAFTQNGRGAAEPDARCSSRSSSRSR